MLVAKVDSNVSFGYHNKLKTLFIKNKFPTVKYGFYGDILTRKNVSLEHLKPRCEGGKCVIENYVLASRKQNNLRGSRDLREVININNARRYLSQFINIVLPNFNGNEYIRSIIETLSKLGINL